MGLSLQKQNSEWPLNPNLTDFFLFFLVFGWGGLFFLFHVCHVGFFASVVARNMMLHAHKLFINMSLDLHFSFI